MNEMEQRKCCIQPGKGRQQVGLRSLWQHHGLIYLFARRDFTSKYRQTVLEPLWIFITLLLTKAVVTVVFGNKVKFPTLVAVAFGGIVIPALGLLGPNGAEKFTVIELFTRITLPSGKHIFQNGHVELLMSVE